jgi:hypothetical protein
MTVLVFGDRVEFIPLPFQFSKRLVPSLRECFDTLKLLGQYGQITFARTIPNHVMTTSVHSGMTGTGAMRLGREKSPTACLSRNPGISKVTYRWLDPALGSMFIAWRHTGRFG